MSVRLRIISAMRQVATEQQVTLPPLTDELSLHETGFDSLGFAILVARLEDDLGIDPFHPIGGRRVSRSRSATSSGPTKMSPREIFALRDYLGPELKGRTLSDGKRVASLTDILDQTCLVGRFGELSGRSVLLAVSDQLIAALAMTELDGVARRMLLCPPDLKADHVQTLVDEARSTPSSPTSRRFGADFGVYLVMAARAPERRGAKAKRARHRMADADLGTSGVPKIVGHTLEALTGAIVTDGRPAAPRRYGRPSTTSGAMAAFRYCCAPSSAAARWC